MAPAPWNLSPAHLRAVTLGAAGTLVAIVGHRPDLLVLAAPLLLVAGWGAATRPSSRPTYTVRTAVDVLHEGEGVAVRCEVGDVAGVRHLAVVLTPAAHVSAVDPHGTRNLEVPPGQVRVTVDSRLRCVRWGVRPLGSVVVVGSSDWGAYRWGPVRERLPSLTVLPVPAVFDAAVQPPHPTGIVGLDRSARTGEGTEFAGIRPFQPGDRVRRVHWPVSLRTRQLHVTSTYADHDTHVLLVVDATTDLGLSGGVDGAASSLDLTVRGAAAVAEHYLRTGERVGMRLIGGRGITRLPAASGRAHLRRVQHELAGMQHGLPDHDPGLTRLGVPAGALVIMLSPLASSAALTQAVTLARRGLAVVVVDTLPTALTGLFANPYLEIAWRIRVLEREAELQHVTESGVPVVRWRGPGSLDQVLRDVGRQAAAPRRARR